LQVGLLQLSFSPLMFFVPGTQRRKETLTVFFHAKLLLDDFKSNFLWSRSGSLIFFVSGTKAQKN
jgi:hypothetical protein